MLDFNINVDASQLNFNKLTTGFITMANQLEPKRFWAIWLVFFILVLGISGALILWAYSLI